MPKIHPFQLRIAAHWYTEQMVERFTTLLKEHKCKPTDLQRIRELCEELGYDDLLALRPNRNQASDPNWPDFLHFYWELLKYYGRRG